MGAHVTTNTERKRLMATASVTANASVAQSESTLNASILKKKNEIDSSERNCHFRLRTVKYFVLNYFCAKAGKVFFAVQFLRKTN